MTCSAPLLCCGQSASDGVEVFSLTDQKSIQSIPCKDAIDVASNPGANKIFVTSSTEVRVHLEDGLIVTQSLAYAAFDIKSYCTGRWLFLR